MNYDNWKLSNPYDDAGDSILVTSCCGSENYETDVQRCTDCGSYDIKNISKGDEVWSVCQECNSIESDEIVDCVCECGEECTLIPLYEYKQDQRDSYYEDMRDDY